MARTKTKRSVGYNRHKLHYDSEFKWRVCQEYLNSNETKVAVQRRNGIQGRTVIVVWLRQFGLNDKPKTLTQSEQLSLMMPQPKPEKVQFCETEIDKLKKELAGANLRADAYQKMIEIAEQEFKIDIRKKRSAAQYVAKQSTPSKQLDPK
jgi:transposase